MSATARLAQMGLALPAAAAAIAAYVPAVRTGNLLVVSGQLPLLDGKVLLTGQFGAGLTIEQGQAAEIGRASCRERV